ncbi:hypothetical protein BFJ68_g1357 [Fusarium oxysporum]|uniref:Uncharacterized protein n=2 Tax=Fusarium oxysporum TaxID=5507 RepID=A0A420S1L2_FUSOX|nr:hypothetical protein BFJ65_g7532 [Fusarium oxysporum f. sp. cepae]RKK28036.1 hypothetical protein BFJ67_g15811 [Fusarium oxysporum f. sp. cepae]RKK34550.1 hypothetical protein BFJ66_g14379 [Fusarium oxysporum f. sp. cepae]RKL23151.1 hypothetical protein BFJ68_g1357 [Fusarium oxysporum]
MNEYLVQRSTGIPGLVYGIAITENWILFCQWSNSFNPSPKPGETHAVRDSDHPAVFYVTPRRPEQPLQSSEWKPYWHRLYTHPFNSEVVHTAGAWEERGKIYFEGTWPRTVLFPFSSIFDGQKKPPKEDVCGFGLL